MEKSPHSLARRKVLAEQHAIAGRHHLGFMALHPAHQGEGLARPDALMDQGLDQSGQALRRPTLDQAGGAAVGRDDAGSHRIGLGVDDIKSAAVARDRDGSDVGRGAIGKAEHFADRGDGGGPHHLWIAFGPAGMGKCHDILAPCTSQLFPRKIEEGRFRHGATGIDADHTVFHAILPIESSRLLFPNNPTCYYMFSLVEFSDLSRKLIILWKILFHQRNQMIALKFLKFQLDQTRQRSHNL